MDGRSRAVIKTCMDFFSILDLARISSSSRSLGQLCESQLCEGNTLLPQDLLRALVKDSVTRPRSNARSCALSSENPCYEVTKLGCGGVLSTPVSKALRWILRMSRISFTNETDPRLSETVRALLHTSNMPKELAEVFVASGFRPTYMQLLGVFSTHGRARC